MLLALVTWPVVVAANPQYDYLDFSGAYVEIADSDALDLATGEFTLSAWIKPQSWGQNDQGRILDHGGGSSGQAGWSLHLENKASSGFPHALRMQFNGDSSFNGHSDTQVIALGVWQHVAVTYDGVTLSFYVDAAPAGQRVGVPTPLGHNAPVRIGARATDAQRFFDGAIDEVRIWDRSLSAQEVMDLKDLELSGLEPGLVAYYTLNEGAGQIATDLSGNGHDGQLGASSNPDGFDPDWVSTEPPNQPTSVSAGADQELFWSTDYIALDGTASDDGLPIATLLVNWSVESGPGEVQFVDATSSATSATFESPGTYVLRLTADDTALTASDNVTIQLIDAQPVLSGVDITPDPATALIGASQQFTAAGFDQTGAPYPTTPAWSATGGVIDAKSGLFTAGMMSGQFEVVATDDQISEHAKVFVTDSLAPWPTNGWTTATPQEMGLDGSLLQQARDYALSGGGSGYITAQGRLVMSWGSASTRYDLFSTTKSIGFLLLGLALGDGLVALGDQAQMHLPDLGVPPQANTTTGWLDDITILNLATHTAGFNKGGGFLALLFQPGTTWAYSDGGMNWLADTLTTIYGQDLRALAFDRVLTQMGITPADFTWRNNMSRPTTIGGVMRREFGSGVSANVDAMARIGYLMLRRGQWETESLIPPGAIDQARTTVPGVAGLPVGNDTQSRFAGASDHYGIMWWNNADNSISGLPTDAYWASGAGDSLIVVIPSLDMVVSRAGDAWSGSRDPSFYQVLEPFLTPIGQAALGPVNEAPTVEAGADQQITLPDDTVTLSGSATDDSLPGRTRITTWSVQAGPGKVSFGNSATLATTAWFAAPGDYLLRLTVSDTELSDSDELIVTVNAASARLRPD